MSALAPHLHLFDIEVMIKLGAVWIVRDTVFTVYRIDSVVIDPERSVGRYS